MAQRKRNKAAEAAAMFEITSVSSEDLSGKGVSGEEFVQSVIEQKENDEIEKLHDEELAEAKTLGIEDSLVVEATTNEVSKDFERQLEESRARYLEAIDDKKAIEEKNKNLLKEISDLSAKLTVAYSELDCLKTDSSREITNYKIEIEDLNETIRIYKSNESNYKAEIAALKADLGTLEDSLEEANKIINKSKPVDKTPCATSTKVLKPFTLGKNRKPRPGPTNGYSSWN